MPPKIIIEICTGTTCYMLGAGRLHNPESWLPETYREHVEIRFFSCENECHSENIADAPFVRIGEESVTGATRETIRERIARILEELP